MPPLPPVTQALLLGNVAVFFLARLLGGGGELISSLALWPLGSGNFWPWQVVTYAFLHGSFEHLFFNMLGLWMFGSALEQVWGRNRYLQFYFASVLAAALRSSPSMPAWARARPPSAPLAACSACCSPTH